MYPLVTGYPAHSSCLLSIPVWCSEGQAARQTVGALGAWEHFHDVQVAPLDDLGVGRYVAGNGVPHPICTYV